VRAHPTLFLSLLLAGMPGSCNALEIELHPPPEASLAKVRRIYVDQLGGGAGSDQIRDMIITAIQNSGLFVVTENPERADAVLKGSSDQKIFTEEHNSSDSIGLHASEGNGSSSSAGMGTSTSAHQNLSASISQSESSHIQERRQEVAASVRLVDSTGDVIWSTTQESSGAKFRGALADVADKVGRRLADETRKARASVAQH
jgi:curli biogenesis system outer membrane secretion channel CsgG